METLRTKPSPFAVVLTLATLIASTQAYLPKVPGLYFGTPHVTQTGSLPGASTALLKLLSREGATLPYFGRRLCRECTRRG